MIEPLDIVLQADPDWLQFWKDGEWFKGWARPYIHLLGRQTMILLLGAPFTFGLWQQTESITVPAVILTLFMGLMLAGAPPAATIVGYILVVSAVVLAYRSVTGVGGP